jgi:hypothetical protein
MGSFQAFYFRSNTFERAGPNQDLWPEDMGGSMLSGMTDLTNLLCISQNSRSAGIFEYPP